VDFSQWDLEEADGTDVYLVTICCVATGRTQPFPYSGPPACVYLFCSQFLQLVELQYICFICLGLKTIGLILLSLCCQVFLKCPVT
jgi:hypothetical protein